MDTNLDLLDEIADDAVRSAFEHWLKFHDRDEAIEIDDIAAGLSTDQRDDLEQLVVDHTLRSVLGKTAADTPRSSSTKTTPPPGPAARGKTNRYQDLRDPKAGGMGVVYRARDLEVARDVAYKVMKKADAADRGETARRFAHEAEITATLQFPGIVPVFGRVLDESGQPAYAMGYIDGTTFREELRRHHHHPQEGRTEKSLRSLLGALSTACRIVEFAHAQGIVHCDLSPKNLMIAKGGGTHVVDWGLARRVGATGLGGSDALTPGYAAPSVALGGPRTCVADVYSLGACLASLVFGITTDGRPDLDVASEGRRLAPRPLRDLIDAALADRAGGPYPTAGALADDLDRYLAGQPILAKAEPWWDQIKRGIANRPAVVVGSFALVVLVLGGFAAKFWVSAAEARAQVFADQAKYSRLTSLESQANEAIVGYSYVMDRPTLRNRVTDVDGIELALKLIKLTVGESKQRQAADRLLHSMTDLKEKWKAAEPAETAAMLTVAEDKIREGAKVLETLTREFPEKQSSWLDLAACYWAIAFIDSGGMSLKYGQNAASELLSGVTGIRTEAERTKFKAVLEMLDKTDAIIVSAQPDPLRPYYLNELRHLSPMLRSVMLGRLGRYTEALIAHDQSMITVGPLERPRLEAEQMIYRMAAEKEQGAMPWSEGAHINHAHAVAMAGYLANEPVVSDAALFNCACAFSLASLDPAANPTERDQRAAKAVALLTRIADAGYFQGAKQIKEFHADAAFEAIRKRADFLTLKTRLAPK